MTEPKYDDVEFKTEFCTVRPTRRGVQATYYAPEPTKRESPIYVPPCELNSDDNDEVYQQKLRQYLKKHNMAKKSPEEIQRFLAEQAVRCDNVLLSLAMYQSYNHQLLDENAAKTERFRHVCKTMKHNEEQRYNDLKFAFLGGLAAIAAQIILFF